jgi:hypothetical protein
VLVPLGNSTLFIEKTSSLNQFYYCFSSLREAPTRIFSCSPGTGG